MDYLIPVTRPSDIHPIFRDTAIADLLAYHNFDRTHELYSTAALVIGMDFAIGEANRLSTRYPKIPVAPLIYRAEDHLLYHVHESYSII